MSSSTDNLDTIKNLNIQKLKDTEGYPTWKTRLSLALRAMSLWDVVDGDQMMEAVADKPEELAKWKKNNDRAMFFIVAAISDEVLMNSDASSAKQLWDSIESAYGIAKEEKVYHIYHRIITTKMLPSENASEHVAKFKTMFQQVESMQEKLSEKFKIAVLLVSLPESYNVKRQILYEKEKQTFNDVCDSVIGHVPEGHSSASESAETALAAFQRRGNKKRNVYTGPPCEHCGMTNHSVSNCYEVHGYPKNYKGSKNRNQVKDDSDGSGRANVAYAEDTEWLMLATVIKDEAQEESARIAGLKDPKDEWCTDSGSTRNVTGHLEILHDVRKLDQPIKIFLAAQKIFMVAYKVGTVRLRTKFGILVLSEVLYIENAAQNLLGLKPLIRKGASVNFTPSGVYIWSPDGKLVAHAPERINENQWVLSDIQTILRQPHHFLAI